jgi:predicted nucleic acid-binding Zn ribbon protein
VNRDRDMHSERFADPAFRAGTDPAEDSFVAVGDALERVRAELGLPEPSALHAIEARWPEIVGADVAAHAHIDAVRDGVVTITADGPVWASQLRYLEAAIVAGAAAVVGPGVVRGVRVRVGG